MVQDRNTIFDYDGVVMRKTAPRNVLAVLRAAAEISQKELAQIVGRSPRTIQAIEINRLPLSEDLATRISDETGVSIRWLMAGDINTAPNIDFGEGHTVHFTKEHFETARMLRSQNKRLTIIDLLGKEAAEMLVGKERLARAEKYEAGNWDTTHPPGLRHCLELVLSTIHAAAVVGRQELAAYRLEKFVYSFVEEFGQKFDADFCKWAEGYLEFLALQFNGAARITKKRSPEWDYFWSPFLAREKWQNTKGKKRWGPGWIQGDTEGRTFAQMFHDGTLDSRKHEETGVGKSIFVKRPRGRAEIPKK